MSSRKLNHSDQKGADASGNPKLPKTPTGIEGLDAVLTGGLPTGRPTLVSGGAGCGKTMLAAEFIVRGASEYNEPGVFMMFEESAAELTANVRSLGFDLDKMVKKKQIVLDFVYIERSEVEETGDYDLEGLFIRLGHAIDSIGAKRVVLDTIEALFSGLSNHAVLRAELRRLFRWLKQKGVTAVITGERGNETLTRFGLEEYVADCVILLDHRVTEQISTRRLRVLKYRGSIHGTNEYPFLIGAEGLSVLPITSLKLDHVASTQRVSTGIGELDQMFDGKGFYRGSSILISGSSGTGKSTLAASIIHAACARGEKCLIFCYEESVSQLLRNMRSVGMDLEPWIEKGLLQAHASRPTLYGVEQHLLSLHDVVNDFKPTLVLVDPISNLSMDNRDFDVKPTLMRLIDFLKQEKITAIFTNLTSGNNPASEESQLGISSLMDTWILLRNTELNGERNRTLYVLKARGIRHSNQVREFILNNDGITLIDAYIGTDGVLTGSARIAQEAKEQLDEVLNKQEHERRVRHLAAKQKALQAQIDVLNAEAEAEAAEGDLVMAQNNWRINLADQNRQIMAERRNSKAAKSRKK